MSSSGGTSNDATTQPLTEGKEIDGEKLLHGYAHPDYGFLMLDRVEDGWNGQVVAVDNSILARCEFRGRSASCKAVQH